jgi:4-alpha-glucanotransferase
MMSTKPYVEQALSLLGIDRLVLAIHDQSFPSLPEEEIGRGSPYSPGGRRFLQFISELGFNGIQLGPQGRTSFDNPSPYDSSLFSKNELSISIHALQQDELWQGVVTPEMLKVMVDNCPSSNQPRAKASYQHAWKVQEVALKQVYAQFTPASQFRTLAFVIWTKQQTDWTWRDSLYEALSTEHGTDDWRQWKKQDQDLLLKNDSARCEELRTKHAGVIHEYVFYQFLVHHQHNQLKRLASSLNVRLYADMQIGFSPRDTWALRAMFLPGYLLGAPPSRTNPNGQPWGYPVLNPELYFRIDEKGRKVPGPALNLLMVRVNKLLSEFDGLRIDHPHGLVCPWVYSTNEEDALHAVQNGARLFETPNNPLHPALAKYAIVNSQQLAEPNSGVQPYADGWVKELDHDQIDRYAIQIDTIREQMKIYNRDPSDLACEVLSSCPFPLQSVLRKNGMGRFRVTQKAQPANPQDVYRSDNAQPPDWIMLGTHDTKPVWMVVEQLSQQDREAWAQYLAKRLEPNVEQRGTFGSRLISDDRFLVEAMFADLFIGPARNVSVFFSDLFGIKEEYNAPGVVSSHNWVLSVPNDYEQVYDSRIQKRQALSLTRALAMALRARASVPGSIELAAKLDSFCPCDANV